MQWESRLMKRNKPVLGLSSINNFPKNVLDLTTPPFKRDTLRDVINELIGENEKR